MNKVQRVLSSVDKLNTTIRVLEANYKKVLSNIPFSIEILKSIDKDLDSIKSDVTTLETLTSDIGYVTVDFITATAVSQTTDFGDLEVGDLVKQHDASNSFTAAPEILTVSTAGTLPEAAVVGDIYEVIRPL